MIKLGLTGSIGMGKSTTAKMFADKGIPVYDADATVHNLYANELVSEIEEAFPGTTDESGVNRAKLSAAVLGRTDQMRKLEAIVHPAVQAKEQQFLIEAQENGAALVVLDIPLLFETGGETRVHKIAVVTAPAEVQRERVLARDGMSEEKFENILKRQIPDEEKRERADFLVFTHKGLEVAEAQVAEIIEQLSK